MDKARIYVDFNEFVDDNVYLLSKDDTKIDSEGSIVTFYEGMQVSIYTDDASVIGETDNILAEGVAIRNDSKKYGFPYVKWCCRVDLDSIIHESDLRFFRLLSEEIKNHNGDLIVLREFLIKSKNSGMDKDRMYKNLQKLRSQSDFRTEKVLLDLMDFVIGFCSADMSVF